jgi:uncharacterized DUF497 family protein
MRITFDPVKNVRNIAERSLPFDRVVDLDWETAVAVEDNRRDYGERRLRVMALLGQRLHVTVVTFRGDAMHVISFRKANSREIKRYGDEKRRRDPTAR